MFFFLLLQVSSSIRQVEQKVRPEGLPGLVGLKTVEGALWEVGCEKGVRLTHKGNATVNAQGADAGLHPVMAPCPATPCHIDAEHVATPDVHMAVSYRLA